MESDVLFQRIMKSNVGAIISFRKLKIRDTVD